MPHYVLFAYVNGTDLDDIEESLEARFRQFVGSRRWIERDPIVVNEFHRATVITETGLDDLWDLGLAVELSEIGVEAPRWFPDVVAIAQFLGVLHREYGRSFSMGFLDGETGRNEELFERSADPTETGKLPIIDGVRYIV